MYKTKLMNCKAAWHNQEDTLETINTLVTKQARAIEVLQQQLLATEQKLKDTLLERAEKMDKPPHY